MLHTRGLPPYQNLNPYMHTPVAIGERDFIDYSHTKAFFNLFEDKTAIYLKVKVWKGIVSSLKLNIMHNLVEAIKGEIVFRRDRTASRSILCKLTPDAHYVTEPVVAAQITIKRTKSVTIQFYSTETFITKEYINKVLIPKLDKIIEPHTTQPQNSNLVNISFCMHSMDGANIMSRQIHCPSWEEVRNNYPYTIDQIDSLFKIEDPDKHGKFIFWHGPAGTGKSYLIRAALQRWKMNIRCMYIVDPENFFNNANYMQEVLLHRPSDADEDDDYTLYDDEDYDESPESAKFRLMIIEDGLNNLLTETRSEREGAISRFLNLTDGILGQGLRLVFLVTSNEKVNRIDPAFLRKGRCLQELEFPEFNINEAREWLTRMDKKAEFPEKESGKPHSLAELYSYLTGDAPDLSKKSGEASMGFLSR